MVNKNAPAASAVKQEDGENGDDIEAAAKPKKRKHDKSKESEEINN